MNKILSQNIHYGYVFTNKEGQYLSVMLRYIMSEPEKKIGDGCWEFVAHLVHYDVDEAKMVGWVVKDQKLKVKKQKIQISHTIELIDAPVNSKDERLKKVSGKRFKNADDLFEDLNS